MIICRTDALSYSLVQLYFKLLRGRLRGSAAVLESQNCPITTLKNHK